jgi:NAD-dependent DNA ligase
MLQSRREISTYDTDGIVIAENRAEPPTTVVKNPTHKVAFKMLLDDQCAKTMVVDVEWNASAHGFLIPRLKITPVVVGTARIEYVTAHNAKFVVDNKIAPGTVIIVKRSGDVIPAVERIVTAAAEPKMPEGTWKWNGVHLELTGDTVSKEVLIAQFVRFSGKFELVGLGPGVAQKLVNAGLDTPGKICRASTATLVAAVGKALGPKLAAQFADLATGTTELQWMVASNCMPRGIGETRLAALFTVEADPRKWSELPAVPAGLSADTVQEILGAMPAYLKWRETQTPIGLPPFPILASGGPVTAPVTAMPVDRGTVCFTGVRDKALEADLTAAGWKSVDSITKSLNLLVVPDGPLVATVKVKKAQDLGSVRILPLSEVRNQILG